MIPSQDQDMLTFRFRPPNCRLHDLDQLTRSVFDGIVADGHALLTTTVINGQTVLRLCTINPRTTDADISSTIDMIARIGADCMNSGT